LAGIESQIRQLSFWARFPAALLAAFAASLAITGIFVLVAALAHITSDAFPVLSVVFAFCTNLLVGFGGVFAGALCLQRADRVIGSAVLLALGIGFEVAMLGPAHGGFHFPRGAIATAIGGALVVAFYFWRRPPVTK
jgi:hypothetical protein